MQAISYNVNAATITMHKFPAASSETQCGNYEVERDEECDAGLQGTIGTDPCCNERCRFKNGANCRCVRN